MPKPKAQARENLLLSEAAELQIIRVCLVVVQPQVVLLHTGTGVILANVPNSYTDFMQLHVS